MKTKIITLLISAAVLSVIYQPAVMLKVYFLTRKKIISTRLKFRP